MRAVLPLLALLVACPPVATDDTAADDVDGDGFSAPEDCNDHDDTVYPGAPEICDGRDNDCAGGPDLGEEDSDGDGRADCMRCETAGYWEVTRNQSDPGALADGLNEAMPTLACVYSDATWYMFLRLDNDGGWVECVYTGRETPVTNQRPDPNTDMNTEHTWPQSQGAGVEPARCDLHHLYPSDVTANSTRADHDFGEVVSDVQWEEGGSMLGDDAGGGVVFEPRDAHKGNVARSMLYFAMRYGYTLPPDQVELFRAWHDLDPVDEAEWARTMDIAGEQAYANPFVACPDLVDRVY